MAIYSIKSILDPLRISCAYPVKEERCLIVSLGILGIVSDVVSELILQLIREKREQ